MDNFFAAIWCKISAVLAVAISFLYNPPEMGKEHHNDISFTETYMFDEKPGSELQIRMAKALVDIIGHDRPLTRDDFLALDRTLNFRRIYWDDPDATTQEGLIHNAMARFINILALVATKGDEKAAEELRGSDEHHHGITKLTDRIREITNPAETRGSQVSGTKPAEPRGPQKSQARILYEQWKARGKPGTVKPPPKRG